MGPDTNGQDRKSDFRENLAEALGGETDSELEVRWNFSVSKLCVCSR